MKINKKEIEILSKCINVKSFFAENEHKDYKILCSLEKKRLVCRYETFGVQVFCATTKGKNALTNVP